MSSKYVLSRRRFVNIYHVYQRLIRFTSVTTRCWSVSSLQHYKNWIQINYYYYYYYYYFLLLCCCHVQVIWCKLVVKVSFLAEGSGIHHHDQTAVCLPVFFSCCSGLILQGHKCRDVEINTYFNALILGQGKKPHRWWGWQVSRLSTFSPLPPTIAYVKEPKTLVATIRPRKEIAWMVSWRNSRLPLSFFLSYLSPSAYEGSRPDLSAVTICLKCPVDMVASIPEKGCPDDSSSI